MDITCWNCKTITKLDKVAVEAAIAQMAAAKMGFHDEICPSCGKTNRTARDLFDAALKAYAIVEPQLPKRELTKKTKEENAKYRGEDVGKAAKKGRK
jgi:predicted transcriptional regulator